MENNKPIRSPRLGQVKLVVWENTKDGITTKSYNPEKNYKDKVTGEWKKTDTYYKGDLQNLRSLIDKEIQEDIKQD